MSPYVADPIYLNGQFLPLADARISPLDRGFLFADGVYEVLEAKPDGFRTAFVPVTEKILRDSGMAIGDIDLFEVNEAFAAVPMRFMQEMGVPPPYWAFAWAGGQALMPATSMFAAFYANELLLKLLPRQDPHPALFDAYAATKPDPEARGAVRAINAALREARPAMARG